MSDAENGSTRAMSARVASCRRYRSKVLDDVAAEAEEVHDVAIVGGVLEAERVSQLVDARQIDDALAKEVVRARARRDVQPERRHVGTDVDRGTTTAGDRQRPHLTVLTLLRTRPINAHERRRFGCLHEAQRVAGLALPGFQRPYRQVAIAGPVARPPRAVGHEVRYWRSRIERLERDALGSEGEAGRPHDHSGDRGATKADRRGGTALHKFFAHLLPARSFAAVVHASTTVKYRSTAFLPTSNGFASPALRLAAVSAL